MLSKIGMKFTRDLLHHAGISKGELLDEGGRNITTGHHNQTVQRNKSKACFVSDDFIYIPLQFEEETRLIVQISETSNPHFTMEKALKLKKILEHSLSFVEINPRSLDPDLENEFLIELLLRDKLDDTEQMIERARVLNFDLKKARQLVFIDIRDFKTRTRGEQGRKKIREALVDLYELLQQSITTYDEYAFYLYDDKFVLLKETSEHLHEELKHISEQSMTALNLEMLFVVSEPCLEVEDYYMSFKKIHAFHQSYIKKETTQPLFEMKDYTVELLVLGLSEEAKSLFLHAKKEKILHVKQQNPDLLATFKVFFKSDLNTKVAAEKMYVHANTIYYRMQKLSESLEMAVFTPTDAQILYMALLLMDL